MKKQKRLNFSLLGVFMLCILAGFFLAHPMKVEAASSKTLGVWTVAEGPRVKEGKYYFWLSENKNELLVSTSKKGKGKAVAKASKGRYFDGVIVFDGSKVFYAEKDNNSGYIYSVKISGKNRKSLAKVKNMYCIQAYYNGDLYVAGGSNMDTYRLNTKTKKIKRIAKKAVPVDQYKQYLLLANGWTGTSQNAYLYNCRTGKSVKISNKVMAYSANFASGKVYYAERINNKTTRIMRCGLNGKNKKTVVKKLSAAPYSIGKMTSGYVYYVKTDNNYNEKYYRYNIKTKKSAQVSQSKYQD